MCDLDLDEYEDEQGGEKEVQDSKEDKKDKE